MKRIAFLSNRDGVGKTLISASLAVFLVQQGKKVCLIDLNFNSPGLSFYFIHKSIWINDDFDSKKPIRNSLQQIDLSKNKLSGSLWVGLSNPSYQSIKFNINQNKANMFSFIQKLIDLNQDLGKDPFTIDILIFDLPANSPFAFTFRFMLAENFIFVLRYNQINVQAIREIISSSYVFENLNIYLLPNLIHTREENESLTNELMSAQMFDEFKGSSFEYKVIFLPFIPFHNELTSFEFINAFPIFGNQTYDEESFFFNLLDKNFVNSLMKSFNFLFD